MQYDLCSGDFSFDTLHMNQCVRYWKLNIMITNIEL